MGRVAFLFPGQGAQYVGMGKEFYDNFKETRDIFDRASDVLGFDMAKLCFEGPKDELDRTENTQPAILTASIGILKAIEKKLPQCSITAGLSLGEYSALVFSGAFKFDDAVGLVKKRGKFMQEAVPKGIGTMAAIVGLEAEKVDMACREAQSKGYVSPANYNSPAQIVIAGEVEAVKCACEKAKEFGAKGAIMLNVSAPFHTKMLSSAADKLSIELKNIGIGDLSIPVITNYTGDYVDKNDIRDTLKMQVMSPVLFEKSVRKMIEDGVDTFIEIGPSKTLSGFVKKIDRGLKTHNIEDLKTAEQFLNF